MRRNKQVSVYLHENIDRNSPLCCAFATLKEGYDSSYWIGALSGFGVTGLTWIESVNLCAAIANTLVTHGTEGMFAGARIVFHDETPSVHMQ